MAPYGGYEIGYGPEIDEGLLEDLLTMDEGDTIDSMEGDDFLVGAPVFRRSLPGVRSMRRKRPASRQRIARPTSRAVSNAMAARAAQNATVVRSSEPTKGREKAMGMASAAVIAALGAGTVTSRPQMLFRAERFVVPASISAAFLLNWLNIGVANQLVTSDPIPCETLQEGAIGSGLRLDSAAVGLDISANVTNISGADATFRATVFGTTVE